MASEPFLSSYEGPLPLHNSFFSLADKVFNLTILSNQTNMIKNVKQK